MEPTFVIAGGQRCGSTSLYHLLDGHPQVYLAKPVRPEPKFFLADPMPGRDRDWYLTTYFSDTGSALAAGEKSTSYMEHAGVAQRIKGMFPEMKIIFILRNPVERAISNYRFSKVNGLETATFDEAIRNEPARVREHSLPELSAHPFAYLARGRYSMLLEQFLDTIARRNLCFVLLDDFCDMHAEVCRTVFEFLGVDPQFEPRPTTEKQNAHAPDDLTIRRSTLDYLLETYYEPNRQLEKILGCDLSHWDRPSAQTLQLISG